VPLEAGPLRLTTFRSTKHAAAAACVWCACCSNSTVPRLTSRGRIIKVARHRCSCARKR
jgi:hypothetical protein